MSGVRLYVGGLGESVDEGVLKAHLATYGNVVQVAVKEKKDAEGIIMTRFAYVNLDASNNQINQCVNTLNGSVWKGSRLKVERARESFMERLQRERLANNKVPVKNTQIKHSQISTKPVGTSQNVQKQQVNKRPLFNTEQRDIAGTAKKKKVDDSSSESSGSDSSDDSTDEEHNGIPMFRGTASFNFDNDNEIRKNNVSAVNENKKYIEKEDSSKSKNKEKTKSQGDSGLFKDSMVRSKDKVEEALLSNFKNFSSVWGDSDDDDDNCEEESDDDDGDDDEDDNGEDDSELEQEEKAENKDIGSTAEEPGFFIDLQPAKVSSLQSGVLYNKSCSTSANDGIEEDGLGDVEAERQAQLDILSGILGKPILASENKTDDKKGQHMKRYDPTLPEHKQYEVRREQQQLGSLETEKTDIAKQKMHTEKIEHKPLGQDKYIKVSENLNFKDKSEGFSLLSMFSQQKAGSSEETDDEEEEDELESAETTQFAIESTQIPKRKKKFFLNEYDAVIDDGIQWLSQSLTQEICDKFDKIRPDLVQVYKKRMVTAKRDAKTSRGRGRGRVMKDLRQQSNTNQNKNFSKDKHPQENSGVNKKEQFKILKRKFEGRGRGRGFGKGRGHIQGKG